MPESIEKSLVSENHLVRIFVFLDRRLGKRRLLALEESIEQEFDWVRAFYVIRMQADEGTILSWTETGGCPMDGMAGSDGHYSKADIQYDTYSLTKFAFSMFWLTLRFAEKQQVPILLDY